MDDEVDDEPKQSSNCHYYTAVIVRRSWQFLMPFFLGWVFVWGASWILPSVYRSGTLILVEEPTVRPEIVPPVVVFQDRLPTITQQILSRTRLLHIIELAQLYPQYR